MQRKCDLFQSHLRKGAEFHLKHEWFLCSPSKNLFSFFFFAPGDFCFSSQSHHFSCLSSIASCTASFSPQYQSFYHDVLFFFCCCEYFTSVAGDYRSQEMKELPIRKGAAFHCTSCLIGRSVSWFHCKTNMIILLAFVIPTTLHYPRLLASLQPFTLTCAISLNNKYWLEKKKKKFHPVQQAYTVCYMQQSHETVG